MTSAALPTAAAVGPKYSLQEGSHGTKLRIGDWTITTTKRPILNHSQIEAAERELSLPLPEMTFGHNSLVLEYKLSGSGSGSVPMSESSPVRISFEAMEALRRVATGEGWEERVGGGVLVSMAETWSRRSATSVLSDVPLSTKPVRPHDWTFSTTYPGHTGVHPTFHPSATHEIPMALLARQHPVLDRILFYDDVSLFEDELHDNGESTLNVRIRVMPHSFFILSRLFVRVDNVLFRIFDVRTYHKFGSNEVIRECAGYEADYDDVKSYLEKKDDLSPLTDTNFVYQVLCKINEKTQSAAPPDSRPPLPHHSSSRIRGKSWPGLGRRVEILNLSTQMEADARDGIERLSL